MEPTQNDLIKQYRKALDFGRDYEWREASRKLRQVEDRDAQLKRCNDSTDGRIIKIATKKRNGDDLDGVGIGNQVYWIPAIIDMVLSNHYVTTDSDFLMAVYEFVYKSSSVSSMIEDVYIPAYPSWKDVLNVRLQHPFKTINGVKYKAKGRKIGFGYNNSIALDDNISEFETVKQIYPHDRPFHLNGHKLMKNRVILGTSNKEKCLYQHWDELELSLRRLGYEVLRLGELGYMCDDYRMLFSCIRTAEFFIGVDSGLMHLADILGIPGFVFWGDTAYEKNKPLNKLWTKDGLGTLLSDEEIQYLLWNEKRSSWS